MHCEVQKRTNSQVTLDAGVYRAGGGGVSASARAPARQTWRQSVPPHNRTLRTQNEGPADDAPRRGVLFACSLWGLLSNLQATAIYFILPKTEGAEGPWYTHHDTISNINDIILFVCFTRVFVYRYVKV